jgi:arylsulfatase A-like enzyme
MARRAYLVLAWLGLALGGCTGPGDVPAAHPGPVVKARAELGRAMIGDESRYVLRGKTHRLPVEIPPGATLETGFGMAPVSVAEYFPATWRKTVDEVRFSIAFEDGDGTRSLVDQRVVRPTDGRNQWHDVAVDAGALAGTRGTLVLAASSSSDALIDSDIVWSNPRLSAAGAHGRTNIILISIDTLRADHLGCYGYEAPTSPNVDRMASEGVVFRNAIASASWTVPSHTSIFTGLDPTRHGVVEVFYRALPPALETLAELLWDRGYETAGFVGGAFVSNVWNFGQGFDRYRENMETQRGEADTLSWSLERATPWLEQRRDRPFFLFLHTYQVHLPYTPPPPYDRLFDPDYSGPYERSFTEKDAELLEQSGPLDRRILRHAEALYDGEIRAMDTTLGELFEFLRATRLAENTCVVFTSDHGDEFGEHGGLSHNHTKLYDELIRVPLIVWCPSRVQGGRVVDGLASHTDILPTILELTGTAVPAGLDGMTLLPALNGERLPNRTVTISEVDGSVEKRKGTVKALRTERHKLIESTIDGSEMLFDLGADRAETTDLAAQQPDLARQVRALADGRPRGPAAGAAPTVTLDNAMRERLRALGYTE